MCGKEKAKKNRILQILWRGRGRTKKKHLTEKQNHTYYIKKKKSKNLLIDASLLVMQASTNRC